MEFIISLISSYRYYGIFFFLLAGCFGPPIPDELLLLVIGYVSFGGTFDFSSVLPLVIAGSLAGTIVNYLVGRFFLYAVKRLKRESSPGLACRMRQAQDLVKRFGPGIVLCSYFLPGLRHWVPVVAGMLKADPAAFGCWAGLGAILWSTAYLTLGYLLARSGVSLPATDSPGLYLAIPGIVFLFLAVWLTRRKFLKSC